VSFRIAGKVAGKSPFKQHRIGAVVVKGGRVLSVGYNEIRWNERLRKENIHAEEAAIVKLLTAGRQSILIGADIYVSRFTRGGAIGLAKPCLSCQRLIQASGIRRAFYTCSDGTTGVLKF
jgi:deoxycytidylate deaminase